MSVSPPDDFSNTGIRLPKDAFVVIVRTAWNSDTVDKLEAGCRHMLDYHKVPFQVITVPGAFEIAFAIKTCWQARKYKKQNVSAFIALGCVLRGDTPHFDYVCRAVTDGLVELNLSLPVPVIFGVLTVDNQQQIDDRTGGKLGNKGEEAAMTALKMIEFITDSNEND
jgi:6,7-dimethyl-8-ribityllumazine synthase